MRSPFWLALPFALLAPACDRRGPAPADTVHDGGEPSGAYVGAGVDDPSACVDPEAVGSYDACCWAGRDPQDAVRLVVDRVRVEPWDGSREGLWVIETEADLADWEAVTGLTEALDVDFATEAAVGHVGWESPGCDERHLDGLRRGDTPGSWFAGIEERQTCEYSDGCADPISRATLYAAPKGPVTSCVFGGYCEG